MEFLVYCCFSVHGAVAEELKCLPTRLKRDNVATVDVKVTPGHRICLTMSSQ